MHNFNRSGTLRYYPGSPLIARQLLRPQDKVYLTELHPSVFPLLRSGFQKDERTKVLRADGYQQLKSQLPPPSRRGLILIYPPYEMKTDIRMWSKAFRRAISASPQAAMHCGIRW